MCSSRSWCGGHHEDQATTTRTDLHPHDVAGHYDVQIGIGIKVPQCTYLYQGAEVDSEEAILWFFDPWSGSWASLHHHPQLAADSYRVRQLGPRHLFDEVETAYHRWRDAGRPTAHQWTFTVTPQHQHISLTGVPIGSGTPVTTLLNGAPRTA